MPRPIWTGQISFGLVNIPVSLYPATEKTEVHFHLLDSRNMARVRYERINEETGEEVPWNDLVKAYEYDKHNYVVLKDEEIKKASVKNTEIINIENFVPIKQIDCIYFDKPYYLIPEKNAEKGYVLLREALKKTQTVGIAKVVIRTRQYLAALMPHQGGLLLNLLHFAQEFRDIKTFDLPLDSLKKYKITPKEIEIAEQLIKAMVSSWSPKQYHDEYRDKLMKWIQQKIKTGKTIVEKTEEPAKPTKIIDFMKLLKKSVEQNSKKETKKKVPLKAKRKQA